MERSGERAKEEKEGSGEEGGTRGLPAIRRGHQEEKDKHHFSVLDKKTRVC